MSATLRLHFEGNRGYGPDQVKTMTLAQLAEIVTEAINEWGGDAEFALYQGNNGRGANYGQLSEYDMFEEIDGSDD